MLRRIKWIAAVLGGLFGIGLFVFWLVLSSSMLAKTRGDLTARLLTGKLGQVVEITGGVVVELGSVLHVTTRGLVLPSQSMTDVRLAEVGQLEFDVGLLDLLKGRVNLVDIQVVDAKVLLVVDQDGTSSWSTGTSKQPRAVTTDADAIGNQTSNQSKGNGVRLEELLAGQSIRFLNSDVGYKDARNGLEIDLLLTSFEMSQKDRSAPVVLQGVGMLNGQDLSLNGNFPQAQPFNVTTEFSQISVELVGTPDQEGYDAGYSVAISVKIAQLGQLLDILKLEKSVSGTGHLAAVFKRSKGSARVEDLDVMVTLDGGQSLSVTGELGELADPSDVTLDTSIRLYSAANKPVPTNTRRDLKLIGIDMQLIAQPGGIPQRRMVIETNGFILDTRGEGPPPISFSEISRTSDGHLRIGRLVLRIGPPEAHFVVFEGSIADALKLEGIDIEGTLAVPMASLLAPKLFQTSDVLGNVSGGFRLSGSIQELGLSNLNAVSQGTDLWNLNVSGSMGNVLNLSDIVLDVAADVPSGAELLSALNLEPIQTGPVKLTTKVSSHGTVWKSEITVAVAESQLSFNMDLDLDDPNPIVRGQIESDLIRVEHLRDIIAAAVQMAKLNDLEQAAPQGDAPADSPANSEGGNLAQPLVLPKPKETDPANNEDGKLTQSLVLSKPKQTDPATSENSAGDAPASTSTSQQSGPFRNVTLHPLVRSVLSSGMDLDVTIDLRKIEGDKGTSSLTSYLEMKDQKARFGPLKFEYDGAHFDISGSMDLDEDPDTLKLSGSTGGWDFGKIMRELRFKKRASGVVYANFDVSGSHASVRDFLATMNGSATVSMRNGSIDSQLLDLAGLGVIPWLFSKERGPTVAIVCARAPLYISNGRISTKQTVVETDRVQFVIVGTVDLKHKTMDITGQPNRIGKPLSRSPWPFTIIGPIVKPEIKVKVKIKDGRRRLRRSADAPSMPQRRKLCVPDILQLK